MLFWIACVKFTNKNWHSFSILFKPWTEGVYGNSLVQQTLCSHILIFACRRSLWDSRVLYIIALWWQRRMHSVDGNWALMFLCSWIYGSILRAGNWLLQFESMPKWCHMSTAYWWLQMHLHCRIHGYVALHHLLGRLCVLESLEPCHCCNIDINGSMLCPSKRIIILISQDLQRLFSRK